jgi:hypothetical protein
MAIFNQVEKKVRMEYWDIIKFQLMTHCYLQKIAVSESDLNCLTYLATQGEQELTDFCNQCAAKQIFSSPQTVRNAINKAERKNLIIKDGKTKKRIVLHPDVKVQTEGNILLDYKFVALATS